MRSPAISLSLYRGILRWARAAGDCPFSLQAEDVLRLHPDFAQASLYLYSDEKEAGVNGKGETVAALCRQAFKACKELKGSEQDAALNRGFEALALLHDHPDYGPFVRRKRQSRELHTDRDGVRFRVGDIMIHARYGYRGVVFGWDRECERGEEWAEQMGVSPSQPFYHVLPDHGDCERLFGGTRATKYVAQENMLPVASSSKSSTSSGSEGGEGGQALEYRGVANSNLQVLFRRYDKRAGRYIAHSKLAYEYPLDCEADEKALQGEEGEGDDKDVAGTGSSGDVRSRGRRRPVSRRGTGGTAKGLGIGEQGVASGGIVEV